MNTSKVSHSQMLKILDYDPDTGVFTWKVRPRKNMSPGTRAGGINEANGYRYIRFLGIRPTEQRAVWFYMTGKFPEHTIDHINGNRSDNRFCNLREATRLEQNQNFPVRKSSAGLTGVSWSDSSKKWKSQIKFNNKMKYLGVFNTKAEAHEAYLKAKSDLHKFCPQIRTGESIRYEADLIPRKRNRIAKTSVGQQEIDEKSTKLTQNA